MSQQKPEFIRAQLVRAILDGDFGERIPREEDLAQIFRVSRGTARTAVHELRARDVVAVTHGRPGAAIRPTREWSLFDAPLLEAALESRIGPDVLAEALECRMLVAPEAAALAAERATDRELEQLGEHLEAFRSIRRAARLGVEDSPELAFHVGVLEASHNRFLARVGVTIEVAVGRDLKPSAIAIDFQQAVLDALTARDPAAAREAMRVRVASRVPARRRRRHR